MRSSGNSLPRTPSTTWPASAEHPRVLANRCGILAVMSCRTKLTFWWMSWFSRTVDKIRHHSGPPPPNPGTQTSDLANVQRQPASWSKQGCIAQVKFQNIGWTLGKNKLLNIEDWGVESTMACCLVFAHWAPLNCHSSTLKHIV
jgi:hypothetical protein